MSYWSKSAIGSTDKRTFAAKNGVYCDLVDNVREAFEACELVRINCQGLNPSDYRKVGAKLKVSIMFN